MKRISRSKAAISNGIFGVAVVVLIVVAANRLRSVWNGGKQPAVTTTLTVTTTKVSTEMITSETAMMNHTSMMEISGNSSSAGCACTFTPKSGAMISSAWFVSAPTEMANQFAVSVHAEGLEPNGTYIVEGTLMTGSMGAVPISSQSTHMNTTSRLRIPGG